MKRTSFWGHSGAGFLVLALLAAVFTGPAVARQKPAEPEAAAIAKRGYCCASWKKVKNRRGKLVQQGRGCRECEAPEPCTAGEMLPREVRGSWNECAGETIEPERLPGGGLGKMTFAVKNCTPR